MGPNFQRLWRHKSFVGKWVHKRQLHLHRHKCHHNGWRWGGGTDHCLGPGPVSLESFQQFLCEEKLQLIYFDTHQEMLWYAQDPLVNEVPIGYGSQVELEIHFAKKANCFSIFLNKVNLTTLSLPRSYKSAFKSVRVSGGISILYLGQMTPGKQRTSLIVMVFDMYISKLGYTPWVPVGSTITFGCPFGMVFEHNRYFTPDVAITCGQDGEFLGPPKGIWQHWPLWPTCVQGKHQVGWSIIFVSRFFLQTGRRRLCIPCHSSSQSLLGVSIFQQVFFSGGKWRSVMFMHQLWKHPVLCQMFCCNALWRDNNVLDENPSSLFAFFGL